MKKISCSIGIFLLCVLVLFSCEFEKNEKFKRKNIIGEISDPFGMATYQMNLYEDSTFYLSSEGTIVHWSEGFFQLMVIQLILQQQKESLH